MAQPSWRRVHRISDKEMGMSQFTSSAKQYSAASPLIGFGSISVNVTTSGTTLDQTAPPQLLGPDNQPWTFLFWDTGRRITNKRTVRWTFNHPEKWNDWRAIAWYGAGGGPQPPEIDTGAFWVGHSTLAPTPVDGPASSYVNGPGGTPLAWPYGGNDHVVRTEWGAATVHAKAKLQGGLGDPQVDFSSWIELVPAGDASGFFSESDDDVGALSSGSGVTGIAGSGSPNYLAAQGKGAQVLAGYVTPPAPTFDDPLGRLRDVLTGSLLGKYIDKGDPSPEDIIRLKLISESIDLVRGVRPTSTDAFEGLTAAAKVMSAQELRRTIVSTQTTLRRGQAAVKYLESLAAKAAPKAVPKAAAKTAAKPRKPAK
jgi:hypothetical protein